MLFGERDHDNFSVSVIAISHCCDERHQCAAGEAAASLL
jgi:hypothetical protein